MLRLGISSLWTHRRRLAGTAIAVSLGVAFLTGTLVLGDTLSHNFDTLFREVSAGTDVVVRNEITVAGSARGVDTRGPIDSALVDQVRRVDGVAVVEPQVLGYGSLIGSDGKAIGGNGPPRQAGSWLGTDALNPYKLVEGRAPQTPDEVVVNRGAAKAGGLAVGDHAVVQTPQPVDVTVVGIATFGSADGFGQTTFTGFTLEGAQQNVLHQNGKITSILVEAAPGVSQETLRDRIAAVLPPGAQAITGQQFTDERIDAIATTFLDLLRAMLVVFAGVALVVATLSINNTFAITIAQRTRELALLRAVGASRRQVRGLVFIEALVVGVVAAAIGAVLGLGVAGLLKGLFDAFGGALPAGGLTVTPIALAIGLVVGIVVTLVAAQAPARRAARVAPLSALRDAAVEPSHIGARRVVWATALFGAGLIAGVAAVATGAALLALAAGLLLVIAVVVGAPILLPPTARVFGLVLRRLRGVNGVLAEQNARRNPRRTAATATALIVGVTVVTLITVLVGSLRATLADGVERGFAADLSVNTAAFGGSQLAPNVVDDLQAVNGVRAAVGLADGLALVDGSSTEVRATDMNTVASVVHVDMVEGALADAGINGLAVSKDKAAAEHWTVGTHVPVTFADGSRADAIVRAIYRQDDVLGGMLIAWPLWASHNTQTSFRTAFIELAPGADLATAKQAIEPIATRYGGDVQDRAEYAAARTGGLDLLLGIVYVLLALAIVIALLGIGNTLSLSVWERRHEIGLLRAIGQTRAQVRSTLRLESIMVSMFGALTGLVLGVFLGWILFRTLAAADAIIAVPVAPVVVIAVVGAFAGALASVRPARARRPDPGARSDCDLLDVGSLGETAKTGVGVEKNDEFELRGVNHIAMVASDMHATIEFYNGVLGMPLTKTLNIPGGGQHFFFDIGNGDSLAFFWFPGAPKSVPGVSSPEFLPGKGSIVTAHGSMNHLAFDVPLERFEAYREQLVAKGVDVSPIVDHDDSESTIAKKFHPGVFVRSFYFQGPDNVMLEFASWTRTMGGPDDVKHAPVNADGVEVEVVYG